MEGNRSCRHPGLLILGLILICTLQDSVAIDAPVIVTLENEGNTDSLKVTWTPLADAMAHVVTWSQPDGSGNDTSPDLSGTVAYYIITGLTPGTLYNVTVTAQNGTDDTSEDSGQGRTKPSPVNLSESGATINSISAEWTMPSGTIDQYIFSCSEGTEDPSSPIAENGSAVYEASCVGLSTAGASHTITVKSQSGNEISNDTTITIIALPNQVVLTEGISTVNSVSATWMKPAGEVTSYDVQCSDGNEMPPPVQTGNGPFSASCTGLPRPGDEYTMDVTSVSNGQRSDVTTIALRALPEAVTLNEESGMVTTTIIAASWNKPNGTVEYYEVSCSDNGIATPDQVDPSDDLIASCTGLSTPGDNYTISVTTVSDDKLSAPSTITITALPEAVTLNEESNMVTTTTVTASWTDATGEFDYYEVNCSDGTASPAQVNPSDDPTASCTGLSTPGDDYSISVTTVSNGQHSETDTITITALPSQVTDLTELGATNDSVSATWTKPDGVVSSYNVTCPDLSIQTVSEDNDDRPRTVKCSGLPDPGPGGNHIIMVVTLSGTKASGPATITITALPSQVTDLTESGATTDSVSATWTKPDGVVSSYNVTCPDGTTQTEPEDNGGSTHSVTCSGLEPGGNHIIMVVTLSGNKASDPATVTITALPSAVSLSEGPSNNTAISATWTMPNGVVDTFTITCSSGTESPASITVGSSDTFTAYCIELPTPGLEYDLSVVAISNNKQSAVSTVGVHASPASVVLVEGTPTTSSVSVNWTQPDSPVESYNISCSSGVASPSTIEDTTQTSYMASCINLIIPGDMYTLIVYSIVDNGATTTSSPIGLVALPVAVTLTEESNMVTTTTITASWTVPNGIVEYYEVSCSDNGIASPAQVNPSDDLRASCTGLSTPGDNYTISVTTVSNGERSETDTITITALPEAVELSPGESNITAISATWTVPNSVVDTFNITCSSGTASPASIPVISSQAGQQLTAYCVGLPKSGEQYDLSVVAISKEKLSAVSTVGVFALPLGVALEEGPSTLTSVSASWMRQNDTVESYSITCSHGDASPSTIEDTDPESFSAACVNLTGPGAMFSMTVYSEVGTNSSSNSTRASSLIMLVAVPESVESISVAQYATTTVDVQWNLIECSECVYNYFLLTFEPDSQEPIRVDYTTGVTEYSSQVSGLTEGRSYNFTVVSVSGVGVQDATLKTSEKESVDQRTVPATPFGLSIVVSERELNLVWGYQGDADNFTITVTPDHGITVFNGDFTDPAAEVTDLIPGTMYDVAIVTVSGDESSEPRTQTVRTTPDNPSRVGNPQVVVVDKNTITLTYESPDEPNGDITSYMISYVGTRDGNPSHEFSDVYSPPVLTVTYDDLYPGFSYTFTIIAVNDGGFESDPVTTEPVQTPQEEPPPVEEDYPYEANTVVSATSTTSFSVVLPEDLFSHDNGELSTFAVIITREANDATVGSTELTYDEARAQNGNMPAYITAIDIPYPFPSQFGSNRKRRATESSATVLIGDGTCSGSPKEYCNKGLDDNTQYYYVFRAYNGRGYGTSGTFGPVTTVKDNTAAIAAGVSVSLIIIIVAVVVVVVFLKRRQPKEPSPRPSLEGRENQGYDGPDQEMRPTRRKTGGSMHRKSHSKPIVLNKFEGHYGRMKADSDFRFTEEYDEIRQVGKDQAIVAATEMVNRAKNRFTNILPYEHSRVKLAALADDPDTDYINANYIPGYNSPREFMACQGPLPGTVDDMWRMIWEKKTSIIVMLTQLVEKGKIKCHEYWPADYNPVTYGSIQVSIQALQQYDHWVIREFSVSQGDEIRKLTQYHFMSWPDHGVPDKTWTMLDFVRTVREAIQKVGSDRPIVAHCSAGVGRTGTYIALDRLMQAMQENDYIDIFGIICEMRMQRNHMVQTEKQYIFIHECVMDLLRRGEEEDTGESIYVNLPSNGFKDPDDVNKNLLDQAV